MKSQSGQIALITLLLMVVVLTIGISIATRSTLDVAMTRQEQEGSRTFQAAEGGLEEALSVGQFDDDGQPATDYRSKFPDILSSGQYVISPMQSGAGSFYFESPTTIPQGGSVQVPITAATGDIKIDWHKAGDCVGSAALLVRVYALDGTTYYAKNYAFSCSGSGSPAGFTDTDNGRDGYQSLATIPISTDFAGNDKIIVSVHPLYADTRMKISGDALSGSGAIQWNVKSTAKNENGDETKAVQVVRSVPMYPSILDYVMYSGTDLVKPN